MKTKFLIIILLFSSQLIAQVEDKNNEPQLFNKNGTRGLGESKKTTEGEDAEIFAENSGTFTDSRDGRTYRWIKINNQIWMADNLAYLPEVYSPKEKDGGYWVYGNKSKYVPQARELANYKTFGVLYNYEAAAKSCPPGWRLPMDYEWRKLESYLGFNKDDLMKKGARGFNAEFLQAERVWGNDDDKANKFGFSAIPSGLYDANYGNFDQQGQSATFWSLEVSNETVWCRTLTKKRSEIERDNLPKKFGFSVRCVKE